MLAMPSLRQPQPPIQASCQVARCSQLRSQSVMIVTCFMQYPLHPLPRGCGVRELLHTVEVSVRDFGTLRVCWKTLNSAHFELQQPVLSAHVVAMWEFRILRWSSRWSRQQLCRVAELPTAAASGDLEDAGRHTPAIVR
jgi:hypothetical protein